MIKTCSIIQPHYIPYKGYFDLFKRSEKIIILDDVQFVKREWKNRNRIRKGPRENSCKWLTVPIRKEDQMKKICDVFISDEDKEWREYHINSVIFSYKKTVNFKKYSDLFFEIIGNKKINRLFDINMKIINLCCKILKINREIFYSSKLSLNETGVEKLIKICKSHNCQQYLANNKTIENYGFEKFKNNKIDVIKQNYIDEIYPQKYAGKNLNWLSSLSILDYIFNNEKI